MTGVAGGKDIIPCLLVQEYAVERQVEGGFTTVAVNLQVQFAVRAFLKMDASLRDDGDALYFGGDGDQTGLAAGEDG